MKTPRRTLVIATCIGLAIASAACTSTQQQKPLGQKAFSPPKGALVSAKVSDDPRLDGVGDDAAWKGAPETRISVSGGANDSNTTIVMKSVYSNDTVSFLMTWEDPTESWLRSPWEKGKDGTWAQLKDPNDKGGDNNTYYEDKMSLIWSVGDSIKGFRDAGCSVVCHAGEDSQVKPYGNKYTSSPGETGDIWHWKSVRNVDQVDDQYLDSTRLNTQDLTKTIEAGRHSDPNDGGGYKDNKTEDGKRPAFMSPDESKKDGSPGYILDSQKVPFDDSKFESGDRVPGVVVAPWTGDRADISAAWKYSNGTWTLEFSRKLETGSEKDVQFDDLKGTYYFGAAIFDNAQVRHAMQSGATPFVFRPETANQ